jgi:SAM-dependent methyltransferase
VSFLRVFGLWLQEKELIGRPDAGSVAEDLTTVAARIAEGAGIEEGSRVLDLGSGTGAVAFAAADRGGRVLATDVSTEALAKGQEISRAIRAPVRHAAADARSLPFADDSFDVSVHRSVLVYMEAKERAVAEELRVLRPGGTVSCSESLGTALDLETVDPGIERVWRGGLREILMNTPDAFTLSSAQLLALYGENGFTEVSAAAVRHAVILDSRDAVARSFAVAPPAGLSARERWQRAGIAGGLVDEFLARLVVEAERDQPATLTVSEGFLTARVPA